MHTIIKGLYTIVSIVSVCLPFALQAQEAGDTIIPRDTTREIIDSIQILEDMRVADTITPRDTIITISDTIIRISDNVISQQGRGDKEAVIITEGGKDQAGWTKLTGAFRKDSTKHVNIIGFPIIAYLPETSLTFGGTLQIYFRPASLPRNRQSSVRIKAQYTLNKQYEAFVEYELFMLKNNRLWFDGIVHYQNWLQEFYGIGNRTEYSSKEIIQFQRWHTDLRMLCKLGPLYLGPQARFSKVYNMRYVADSTFANAGLPAQDGYQTIGLGPAIALDTRDNNIFPYKGYYITVSNYNHPRWLSQDAFRFQSVEFDYRHFFNPRKGKHVLVIRAYALATFGDAPFRLNALHGGQYFGRGYYEGRYTDNHMVLAQTEWRFPIVWRFRGVLFASAADVFNKPKDLSIGNIKWAFGAGIRFIVNPKERNSIRFDYAHGRNKADKGFYFGVNEVF